MTRSHDALAWCREIVKIRFWIPSLLWMSTIFLFSTDLFSASQTGSIFREWMHFLFPNLSETWIHRLHVGVRKSAHMGAYAVLSTTYWIGLTSAWNPIPKMTGRLARVAFWGAVLYACSDEFHQSFSNVRTASWGDVFWDAAGAGLSLCLLGFLSKNQAIS